MTEQPGRNGDSARQRHSRDSVLDRFVGRSPRAQAVREMLQAVAASDASVLILGASGTGKELAAQIIHRLSARAGGTFVAIDGGALAEGLVESELFGHARGAYTGAVVERRGLLEEAHNGTLFLDEVGNVSSTVQTRLLRVLESRVVRRIGENMSRRVDFRLVAATNRDLFAEVRAGRFREDLLFRLDIARVELPTLRERREDVPLLAQCVLQETSARLGKHPALSEEAVAALCSYDWPGNVRELRNVVESAAVHAGAGRILVEHLPRRVRGTPCPDEGRLSLAGELHQHERAVVLDRLVASNWNVTTAARALGLSRQHFYDRLHALGLWDELRARRR